MESQPNCSEPQTVKSDKGSFTDAQQRGSRATRRIKGSGFPARRHTRVCMLSPDTVMAVSPLVNVIIMPRISALLAQQDSIALLVHSEPRSKRYRLLRFHITMLVSDFFPP